MSTRSFGNVARDLLKLADDHDVTYPDDLAAALRANAEVARKAVTWTPDSPTLEDAVADALAEGRDPLDDPGVARAVAADVIRVGKYVGDPGRIVTNIGQRIETLLRTHADDIIATLQPVYDKAAAKFQQAHAALTKAGITGLNDGHIVTQTTSVFNKAKDARDADATMTAIQRGIAALDAMQPGSPTRATRAYRLVDTTGMSSEDVARNLTDLTAWGICDAGRAPKLHTYAEARAQREAAQQHSEVRATVNADADRRALGEHLRTR